MLDDDDDDEMNAADDEKQPEEEQPEEDDDKTESEFEDEQQKPAVSKDKGKVKAEDVVEVKVKIEDLDPVYHDWFEVKKPSEGGQDGDNTKDDDDDGRSVTEPEEDENNDSDNADVASVTEPESDEGWDVVQKDSGVVGVDIDNGSKTLDDVSVAVVRYVVFARTQVHIGSRDQERRCKDGRDGGCHGVRSREDLQTSVRIRVVPTL
jgi:hypothetical protein